MRGFTLSRGSYEKKDGIGRGSHTSPKIPVGSVTVDCGLMWDQQRNMWPVHSRLGTTGSGRTWAYGCLCQTGRIWSLQATISRSACVFQRRLTLYCSYSHCFPRCQIEGLGMIKEEAQKAHLPGVEESRSLPANLTRDPRQEPPLIIQN